MTGLSTRAHLVDVERLLLALEVRAVPSTACHGISPTELTKGFYNHMLVAYCKHVMRHGEAPWCVHAGSTSIVMG